MANKKTKAQLETENKLLRRSRTSESVTSVLNNLIRWGGAIAIARYGYLSIASLAGESTMADIGVNVLADFRISQALAWVLAGGTTMYGLSQKKLRRDTVERLQSRIQAYELEQDPGRTTSRLTPRGETRPEDKG
jgi:hypothetical protein